MNVLYLKYETGKDDVFPVSDENLELCRELDAHMLLNYYIDIEVDMLPFNMEQGISGLCIAKKQIRRFLKSRPSDGSLDFSEFSKFSLENKTRLVRGQWFAALREAGCNNFQVMAKLSGMCRKNLYKMRDNLGF